MSRPKLSDAKKAFKEVYGDVGKTVSGVGKKMAERLIIILIN